VIQSECKLLKNLSIFFQKMRRFLVGKGTGVSNLLIDIESVVKF
jgi:hypothetical protein